MYLDYAGIRVSDLERSVRFYTEGVGLRELRRETMTHGGIWVLLQDPVSHQQLELNWYPPGSRYDVPFVTGEGLDHLGLRVEDLDAARQRLVLAGARPVDRIEREGDPSIVYLEDPDGHWLELFQPHGEPPPKPTDSTFVRAEGPPR
ncbi:MAG: VOC family protein [Thermoplasmata archaeon]